MSFFFLLLFSLPSRFCLFNRSCSYYICTCSSVKQQKKPTWNRQEQLPLNAVHVLNERITKSFCFRLLTDVLTRKSNARQGGPHFGSNSLLYGAKLKSNARVSPGYARGGDGRFWNWLVHNYRNSFCAKNYFWRYDDKHTFCAKQTKDKHWSSYCVILEARRKYARLTRIKSFCGLSRLKLVQR